MTHEASAVPLYQNPLEPSQVLIGRRRPAVQPAMACPSCCPRTWAASVLAATLCGCSPLLPLPLAQRPPGVLRAGIPLCDAIVNPSARRASHTQASRTPGLVSGHAAVLAPLHAASTHRRLLASLPTSPQAGLRFKRWELEKEMRRERMTARTYHLRCRLQNALEPPNNSRFCPLAELKTSPTDAPPTTRYGLINSLFGTTSLRFFLFCVSGRANRVNLPRGQLAGFSFISCTLRQPCLARVRGASNVSPRCHECLLAPRLAAAETLGTNRGAARKGRQHLVCRAKPVMPRVSKGL